MPSTDLPVVPNVAEVAAKVMDGEAILINLTDGMYFSLDGVGGFLWGLIEQHHTPAEMADALVSRYDVAPQTAEADVMAVLGQLLDARLVLTDAAPRAAAGAVVDVLTERLPYQAATLQAYTDMAELLALDPPHPSLTNTLSKNLVD